MCYSSRPLRDPVPNRRWEEWKGLEDIWGCPRTFTCVLFTHAPLPMSILPHLGICMTSLPSPIKKKIPSWYDGTSLETWKVGSPPIQHLRNGAQVEKLSSKSVGKEESFWFCLLYNQTIPKDKERKGCSPRQWQRPPTTTTSNSTGDRLLESKN